jgi:peptide/nickel transport system substrate-binding protein
LKASFFPNLIQYFRKAFEGLGYIKTFRPSSMRKVFSLMGKREKAAFILLALTAIISAGVSFNNFYIGHTQAAPDVGGEYREGLLGQPRLLNPLLATSPTDTAITRLVFSGLYKYDGSGNILADLAEGMPEISTDQKQYTVHIKKGVKWHNDKQLTADDVVFTIKTLQDPGFKSPLRSSWLHTTVEKIDDNTVIFKNRDVSALFLQNLTLPMLSKYVWGKVSADTFVLSSNNLEAVGTGPYVIREIKKLPSGKVQSIKLESFSNYYMGKPYVESLVFNFYDNNEDVINALHSKEVQGFGFIPLDDSLYLDKKNKNLNILELPLPQYQAVFLNTKKPLLADKNVRKALSLATNAPQILKDVFNDQGKLINGPVLPEQLGISNQTTAPSYDASAAAALLDAGGWKVNPADGLRTKGKTILEITLATNDSPLNAKTAEILIGQWKALNVKVNLNVLPNRELSDSLIRPRKFDALLFSQNLGADPDPFAFWHSSQSTDPGLNITGFANAEADKLISAARSTINDKERTDKYVRFQEIINAEVPAIFLNQTVFVYAVDSKIKNIALKNLYSPAYRFYDTPNWNIAERRVWK